MLPEHFFLFFDTLTLLSRHDEIIVQDRDKTTSNLPTGARIPDALVIERVTTRVNEHVG